MQYNNIKINYKKLYFKIYKLSIKINYLLYINLNYFFFENNNSEVPPMINDFYYFSLLKTGFFFTKIEKH